MATAERSAFEERMQVLGFKNREISVIWNVMNFSEDTPVKKEDFNSAIEFIKIKHS